MIEDYNEEYAELYDASTSHRDYESDAKGLLNWFSKNTDLKVLDFGCGTGSHLCQILRMGFRGSYWGVESSEYMRNKALEKKLNNIVSTISDIPAKMKAFSHVYSLYNVLNCIEPRKLQGVIEQLYELLGKPGYLLFEIWNSESLKVCPPKIVERTVASPNFGQGQKLRRVCVPEAIDSEGKLVFNYHFYRGKRKVFSSIHRLYIHEQDKVFNLMSMFDEFKFIKNIGSQKDYRPSSTDRFLYVSAIKR